MGESLEKDTVNPIIAHPLKMPQDRFSIAAAEDIGRAAIACLNPVAKRSSSSSSETSGHRSTVTFPGANIFSSVSRPVRPTKICTVPFAVKPTLIATHDFARQRASIDGVLLTRLTLLCSSSTIVIQFSGYARRCLDAADTDLLSHQDHRPDCRVGLTDHLPQVQ